MSWNNGADYDLQLDMPGSVRDVESCSMEHAYVYSEFEIYPGRYPVNVTQASTGNVSGVYYVSIATPAESKVIKVDANTTGHIADITVKYVDNKPVLELSTPSGTVIFENSGPGGISGGGGGSSSSSSSSVGGHSYIPDVTAPECSPAKSCGCMPCEYWVVPYLSQAMTGPLSGADIALYRLEGFRTDSAIYNGKTSTGNTLYTAGLLNIPEETIAGLDDNALYVITVSGGMDIDADDNMEVDDIPTQNLGTLHAILKGSELKATKPKVNILTEVAYQIVKDDIANASKTDDEIIATLDDVALRLLRMKIYTQSEGDLSHVDLLEWLPTLEKSLLYVSYQNQVVPIVKKLLLDNDIYEDAYNLVYVPNGVVPVLQSQIFTVLEDISVGTVIGTVPVQYEGNSSIVDMQLYGAGSDKFSIDSSGTIRLVSPLDFETKQLFSLYVRAQNDDGFSKYTAIYIQVEDVVDAPYAVSFSAEYIYANAAIGTKVGQIIFNTGSSAITSMQLTGADSTYFTVDNSGNITTAMSLEDFFVKKAYLFDVVASNSSGASRPASIIINVGDRRDIPQLNSLSANVDENAPADTVVAKVPVISDGDSPIITYTLSDNTQFVIDNNGTIRVAPNASLDYEIKTQWTLSVTASNIIGDSRPQNVTIALNDIPDVLPTLHPINLSINKETAVGAVVANVLSNGGDTPITSFTLSPDSPFSVDLAGDIRLESSLFEQDSEHFTLQASATNSFGKSESVDVNITLIVVPVVSDLSTTVFDNTSAGTIIGKINIIGNGNPIESVALSGDGSSDFHVDLNGTIKVSDGVTITAARQAFYQLGVSVNGTHEASVQINVLDRIIGSVGTSNYLKSVVLSKDGTTAFLIDQYAGLQIIDVRNPAVPTIIGSIDTPGNPWNIILSKDGTKAFIADDFKGLQIVDSSDPTSPFIISTADTLFARDVVLSADEKKAFVSTSYGLKIVDITDLTTPVIIGSVDIPNAFNVALSADERKVFVTVFSSQSTNSLQIIDVSDLTAPSIISSINMPTVAWSVSISPDGTKAYVTDLYNGLIIVNVSNPNTPSIIGEVDTPSHARGIALSVDGTKVYVADEQHGLQIIDISEPTAPSIIASVNTPEQAWDVAVTVDETKAFVVDRYSRVGLQIISVDGIELKEKIPGISGFFSIMEEDSLIGSYVGKVQTFYTGASGIASLKLSGEGADDFSMDKNGVVTLQRELNYNSQKLYHLKAVATNSIGDREVDVTIRVHSVPELQDFTGEVKSMATESTYVGQIDMWIDDNTTITDIAIIGDGSENFKLKTDGKIHVDSGAEFHHFVTPKYNLTAIATNNYGSSKEANVTIEVSALVSSIKAEHYGVTGANKVVLSDDETKVYVTDGGLGVIDISDVTAPSAIGWRTMPYNYTRSVALSKDNSKVFVANQNSGLRIIDVSNPTNLDVIATIDTPGYANDVILSTNGETAFVADGQSGMQLIDVSDPFTPSIISSVDTPGNVWNLSISENGSKVIIADISGIQVIDISDTLRPLIVASATSSNYIYAANISKEEDRAYATMGYNSGVFQILDISDQNVTSTVSSLGITKNANKIVISKDGRKVFVADGEAGLLIINISDSTAPSIIEYVNPAGYTNDIVLSADETKAFVADSYSGLQILDLTGLD